MAYLVKPRKHLNEQLTKNHSGQPPKISYTDTHTHTLSTISEILASALLPALLTVQPLLAKLKTTTAIVWTTKHCIVGTIHTSSSLRGAGETPRRIETSFHSMFIPAF